MVAESVRTNDYFQHADRVRVPEHMTDATRYLSAAPYLDYRIGRKIARELIDNRLRAIVPSYGFDIGPVLVHCLRARRMRILYDLVTVGALVIGFLINPLSVLVYVLYATPFLAFSLIPWRRMEQRQRIVTGLSAAALYLYSASVVVAFGLSLFDTATGYGSSPQGWSPGGLTGLWRNQSLMLLTAVVMFGAMFGLPFAYRIQSHRVMRRELYPSALTPSSDMTGMTVPVRARIEWLAAAQLGNITLSSADNPFLGSGKESPAVKGWSIVLELDRPAAPAKTPQAVCPVELHEHVRRALIAMSEEWPLDADDRHDTTDSAGPLPTNERINGLSVGYQVVAPGTCHQYRRNADTDFPSEPYDGHPLIDGDGVPFSKATDAAREAIIRHPQANMRCFQRVTVGTAGQAIRNADHALIVPASESDIVVSAFIYLAVEGRMLYVQFLVDVLPPVRPEFRIVDELPSFSTVQLLRQASRNRRAAALGESLSAPFRLVRTMNGMWRGLVSESTDPTKFTSYDYGARLSVREESAAPALSTLVQGIDVNKYSRLIEWRLQEAMLDYLQRHDIDVSMYRQQLMAIHNRGVMVVGGGISGGQFAAGVTGGQINQQSTRI